MRRLAADPHLGSPVVAPPASYTAGAGPFFFDPKPTGRFRGRVYRQNEGDSASMATSAPDLLLPHRHRYSVDDYYDPGPNGYRQHEDINDRKAIPVPGVGNVVLDLRQLT